MSGKIDSSAIMNVLETSANVSKIISHMTTEKKAEEKKENNPTETNSTNQPHTQMVEVKVGNDSEKDKQPVILKEKHETHVHKPYPEGRALSKDECEVEKLRITTAQAEAREAREYNLVMEERARKERKERDDYARQENERRREERRKRERRGLIYGSIFAASCLGIAGYCLYTDYRSSRAAGLSVQKPAKVIKAEGSVK